MDTQSKLFLKLKKCSSQIFPLSCLRLPTRHTRRLSGTGFVGGRAEAVMSCDWIKDTVFIQGGSSGERTDFASMLIGYYIGLMRPAVHCLQSLLSGRFFFSCFILVLFFNVQSTGGCPARIIVYLECTSLLCVYLKLRCLDYNDTWKGGVGLNP